ncbi:MAG: iron hydrogenase small subunit [Phycisphaeraceae bacterium]|nr:iron hydrogenase small subunit [Phycisphaeraceae bacterium]
MINATINGREVTVPEGTTILDAARKVQVRIPKLCKHDDLPPTAACGICIVRINGNRRLPRACCTPVEEGMRIITHDPDIVAIRKSVIEMILSKHPNECFTCGRNGTCELQALAADFGVTHQPFTCIVPDLPKDDSTRTIVLEPRKCITCGRCLEVCQQMQNVWALSFLDRGFATRISPAGEISLAESPCVRCGQCSAHCPTGAIFEYDETGRAWDQLKNPEAHCVVQIAPAVRVAIGEAFGLPPGTNCTGRLYHALRMMGFKAVFDTNFGADLTILEEAHEFVERFAQGIGALPLITSCCPAWIDYMEKYYGDLIDEFSSAKSPHAMVGVLTKTYYADRAGVPGKRIFGVSIMPCTAKKYEIGRTEDMYASGLQDIDCVLTTRELARMIKQAGIDFANLPNDGEPDHILGDYTGAATLFGVTGGVMEAALRTAHKLVTGEELPDDAIEFHQTRGLKGIKEATLDIGGNEVRIAVAHGLGNVQYVLEKVKEARAADAPMPYHFIEVMACPGGCIGGGGQPYGVTDELRAQRAAGLYEDDRQRKRRRSHDNPYVQQLYQEFLEKPLSHKAHELLHTRYKPRPLYYR